jgi:hypothetical protein
MNKERINLISSSRILSNFFDSSAFYVWRFCIYFVLMFLLMGINRQNVYENRMLTGYFGRKIEK